jgi:hypothetical protein
MDNSMELTRRNSMVGIGVIFILTALAGCTKQGSQDSDDPNNQKSVDELGHEVVVRAADKAKYVRKVAEGLHTCHYVADLFESSNASSDKKEHLFRSIENHTIPPSSEKTDHDPLPAHEQLHNRDQDHGSPEDPSYGSHHDHAKVDSRRRILASTKNSSSKDNTKKNSKVTSKSRNKKSVKGRHPSSMEDEVHKSTYEASHESTYEDPQGSHSSATSVHTALEPNSHPSKTESCKRECDDLNISTLYESLLSKNLINNHESNTHIAAIFLKIFNSMKSKMSGSSFESSVHNWTQFGAGDTAEDLGKRAFEFPANQKHRLATTSLLPTKERAFNYAIGLMNDIHNDPNPTPNPSIQLDYLIFHSKGKDEFGIPEKFAAERDVYFNNIVRRLRGYRSSVLPEKNRTQYGISFFDVPALEAPEGSYPWRHWGRDSCLNDPSASLYSRNVSRAQIPLACGISGTTNLTLWTLFSYKTDLDENEMRLFLLSIWTTLCADGGHSLQEVLTSAKILSMYLSDLVERDEYFKRNISSVTLASLEKVTKDINPLGNMEEASTESNEQSALKAINDKIYGKQYPNLDPKEVPEMSSSEKEVRKELEHYFSHHPDVSKSAKFGSYFDAFFSKIEDSGFKAARKHSQIELDQYVEKTCSGNKP